jgi:hypothetical protein
VALEQQVQSEDGKDGHEGAGGPGGIEPSFAQDGFFQVELPRVRRHLYGVRVENVGGVCVILVISLRLWWLWGRWMSLRVGGLGIRPAILQSVPDKLVGGGGEEGDGRYNHDDAGRLGT